MKIFLSYSHQDGDFCNKLADELGNVGHDIWIDKRKLKGGDIWDKVVRTAIEACDCVIVALSPASVASDNVRAEWGFAREKAKMLIPIQYRGCEVPILLRPLQTINFAERSFGEAFHELLKAIPPCTSEILEELSKARNAARRWQSATLMTFILALIAGLVSLVALMNFRSSPSQPVVLPDISLASLRYKADGFDPRLADLRTIEADGIPVRANLAFQIDNLWVSVSGDTTGYTIGAELYAGDEYIGATDMATVQPGMMSLGEIIPKNYIHGLVKNAVNFQASWDHLIIALSIYRDGVQVHTARTTIKIDPNGTSWVWDAPHANFASVVYSINSGPELVFDPRARLDGIDAHPGDQITLHQVWYRSDSSSANASIQVEAYITAEGYDPETVQVSPSSQIRRDLHPMDNFRAMTWQVRSTDQFWVIYLDRSDWTVLDSYIIPLNASKSPGLVSSSSVFLWPSNRASYLDFENQADLGEWSAGNTSSIAQSSTEAFSGSSSLAVTTTSGSEDNQKVFWNRPLHANAIVGQVYWPEQSGVQLDWAQFCAWTCVPIDVQINQWNTFSMDVSELTFNDTPLSQLRIPQLWIQVQLSGPSPVRPYTFYVDGIQHYPSD